MKSISLLLLIWRIQRIGALLDDNTELQSKVNLPEFRNSKETFLGSNQSTLEECSICGRLKVPLLPDSITFVPEVGDTPCGDIQESINADPTIGVNECQGFRDWFESSCCDQSSIPPSYECQTNVRKSIFSSYDTVVPPLQGTSTRSVDIDTYITYHFVEGIDLSKSLLEIFVSVTLEWFDPRLAWDITNSTCVSSLNARASHNPGITNIWVPQLDLLNRASSFRDFVPSMATVRNDGRVTWSRIGNLEVLCSFIGLDRIPYDTLGCRLHIADVEVSNTNYILPPNQNTEQGGLEFSDYTQTYSEYTIVKERSVTGNISHSYFYVDLYFRRAMFHFIAFTILPNMFFTFMSFGQFFLETTSGERLSYGVTILLILVTQDVITASLLPICNEQLWLNVFNLVSTCFTLFGLLETLVILWMMGRLKTHDKSSSNDEERESLRKYDQIQLDEDLECESSGGEGPKDELERIEDPENELVRVGLCEVNNAISQDKKSESLEQDGAAILSKTTDKKRRLFKLFPLKSKVARYGDNIDRLCAIILPILYLIFLLVMFTTNPLWEDSTDALDVPV